MRVTIFQYEESPEVIENVRDFHTEEDGELIVVVSDEGREEFNINDVMRWEGTNG